MAQGQDPVRNPEERAAHVKKTELQYIDLLTRNFQYGVYKVTTPSGSTTYVQFGNLLSSIDSFPAETKIFSERSRLGEEDKLAEVVLNENVKYLALNPAIYSPIDKEQSSYSPIDKEQSSAEGLDNKLHPISKPSLLMIFSIAENRRRSIEKLPSKELEIFESHKDRFPTFIQ